jgi:tetratricopeptide (TPR) repeat protein
MPAVWRVVGLTAQGLIRRGEQAFSAKQFAEAQWWYEQASELAPDFPEEWRAAGLAAVNLIMRGEQAYAAKRYTEALWWYEQATLLAADLRDAWQATGLAAEDLVERGKQAHRAGRWHGALWWYEQAKVLDPGLQSSVLYLQYLTLADSGETGSALPVLQEAVSQDRGWLDADMRFHARYLWGAWLYQQGRNADAEDALSRAVALLPQGRQLQREHSESYRLLGLLQEAQGKLEQAVQSLQMAVRLDEGNVWAHSHFGQVLYMYDASRAPEVEREFSVALSLRPENVGLWENLIRFWLRAGEKERATSLCSLAQERGLVADLEEVCPAP